MLSRLFNIVFFCLLFSSPSIGQTYSFRHFTTEDGLPSSEVHDVVQDDNGYMWFATDRGLVRFDGYDFETYTTEDGLVDNVLLHLKKDNEGKIWFASLNNGLGYVHKSKIYKYTLNNSLEEVLSKDLIVDFDIDNEGTLYIGSKNKGLLQISKDGVFNHDTTQYRYKLALTDNNAIHSRYFSKQIHPNTSYYSALEVSSIPDSTFYSTSLLPYIDKYTTPSILSESVSDGSATYFSHTNLLFKLVDNTPILIERFDNTITALNIINEELWIGILGGGVEKYSESTHVTKFGLSDKSVSCCYMSDEKIIWVTTLDDGVFAIYNSKHYSITDHRGKELKQIISIGTVNNKLQILDHQSYLIQFDQHKKQIDTSLKLNNEHWIPIYFPEKNIYLIKGHHLDWHIIDSSFFFHKTTALSGTSAYKNDTLYSLYDDKFFERNDLSKDSLALPFGINICPIELPIEDLIKCEQVLPLGKKILFGGKAGIFEYDLSGESNKLISWSDFNPLFSTRIIDLKAYPNTDFIAGTREKGVMIVKNKVPLFLNQAVGLLSNDVTYTLVDNKTIWVGTSQGLSRIDSNFQITNLRMEDGLISNEVTALAVDSNNVYVGTKKGLTVLDKNHIDKQEVLIPVLINSVELKGVEKHVPENNQLSISYEEPYININFVGISYKSMGRIRYRYRLQQEDDWQYTSNTTLLFNNLGSGKYTLEIQATNGDNNWDSPITSLNIFVTYPFWRTTPFYVIAILSFLSLFYLFYKLSITRIKNKEAIKHQIQNLRFEALSAQMNPHFMFNSLNAIQNFIMQNEKKSSVRYLSKFAKLMRITLNHSQAKNITLAEELSALELYLQLEQLRFDHQFDFTIEISKNLETDKTIFPALLIQPIVENAILHGIRPAKHQGHILIKLRLGKSGLHVSVRDNGVGRNPDKAAQETKKKDGHISKGSLMTQERVALFAKENKGNHSYEIIDHSENGIPSGTEVKILLPFVYLLKVNAE